MIDEKETKQALSVPAPSYQDDEPTWPGGGTYEEVPRTDLSPLAVAVGAAGIYLGRALLALGLVCFVVAALYLVGP